MKLTREEIRVVAFLLFALVLGAVVKNYRHRNSVQIPAAVEPR